MSEHLAIILGVFVVCAVVLRIRFAIARGLPESHWLNRWIEGPNRKHSSKFTGGDYLSTGAWDDVYQMEGYTPKSGEYDAAERRNRGG